MTAPGRSASGLTPARVWWLAARPATLAASASPVLAGTALAVHDGAHRPLAAVAALLVSLAMQIGVNYANDYSDYMKGADNPRRVGPVRAAASGLVPPGQVKLASFAFFGLAAVVGVGLSLATDWRLIVAGVAAVLAGWFYTGGPRPYGYMGLGEVFVFVFFGLLATVGTVYVQLLSAPLAAWLIAASMGFLACAVLALNNLRDVETDAEAGKRTLAVRLGRRRTRLLIGAFFVAALLPPVLAVAYGGVPPLAVLPLVTVAPMLQVHRASRSREPRILVWALKRAALIESWFALLWAVGLLIVQVINGL
jgi:1,4-dihydroxy-2-naphthoate polyprenyltransferase